MIGGSLAINGSACCSSALLLESKSSSSSSSSCCSKRFKPIVIRCNNNNNNNNNNGSSHEYNIPKLEPFSRTKFDRGVKDPPLIQKSESQLADYCSTLEGDTSYNCWQAYFELRELEKETSKEEVEKLIIEAGGVKSLIGCLHGVAAIRKANKEEAGRQVSKMANQIKQTGTATHHVPDGLPKTEQEMEEEERAKMPDSPLTRLLRLRGKHPAWYSPVPDHQSD